MLKWSVKIEVPSTKLILVNVAFPCVYDCATNKPRTYTIRNQDYVLENGHWEQLEADRNGEKVINGAVH